MLVTGGNGYLGAKVIASLRHVFDIVSLDITPIEEPIEGVRYVQGSVLDAQTLGDALSGVSVVIHAAAMVPLTKSSSGFQEVNVLGAHNVARAAANVASVEQFVHISSSAVFGKKASAAIKEGAPRNPIEPYGKSKRDGEDVVTKALAGSNVRLSIVRPRTILGPDRGGIFDLFFSWILEGKPIFTIGNGLNRFQFVHVTDLIAAIEKIVSERAEGEFNVGTESYGSLNEVFEETIAAVGSSSTIVHLPKLPTIPLLWFLDKIGLSPLAPWHFRTFHYNFEFDLTPLRKLGWRAKYSNNQMFEEAIRSYASDSKVHARGLSASPHTSKLNAGVLGAVQKIWVKK